MELYKGYTEQQLKDMALDIVEFISGEENAELELCYVKKEFLLRSKIEDLSVIMGNFYRFTHASRLSASCADVHDEWRDELIDFHKKMVKCNIFSAINPNES